MCTCVQIRVYMCADTCPPTCEALLQRIATHCNALQRIATHCNALQHTASMYICADTYRWCADTYPTTRQATLHLRVYLRVYIYIYMCVCADTYLPTCETSAIQCTATHCNTLQHTAPRHNPLQHTATDHACVQTRILPRERPALFSRPTPCFLPLRLRIR